MRVLDLQQDGAPRAGWAGRLIGRRGAAVRRVEMASGARVQVLPSRLACVVNGTGVARSLAVGLIRQALAPPAAGGARRLRRRGGGSRRAEVASQDVATPPART